MERFTVRERAVIMGGGMAAGLILLYFFALEPAYYSYQGMKGEIVKVAGMVARYKAAASGVSQAEAEKRISESDYKRLMESVFINETDALAAAQMAEMVRAKAASAGISLSSSKTEKPELLRGFRMINLSVSFNASLSTLSRFMLDVRNDQKKMIVREAKIASQKEDYPDTQPETLSVRLMLTGLRFVPGEEIPGVK
jgi:type II secretory pathway component PulM